jgi:hypothetical protein
MINIPLPRRSPEQRMELPLRDWEAYPARKGRQVGPAVDRRLSEATTIGREPTKRF